LQVTVARVNDVLNDKNRANLSASLDNVRGVLEENRKPLHSTVMHFDEASAKIAPLLDDLKKTNADAQKTINTLEGTVAENRGDLRQSIEELRHVLDTANNVTDQLDRTLNANGENIDDILNNFRQASQNLRQFTETLKQRPYTLLRSALPPAHVPGQASKSE
jgi:ABC-type transporter Mla subunit MlaD